MTIIEHIKQHYWITGIIVVLTLGISNTPVFMTELRQLPFQAWMLALVFCSTVVITLYLLVKLCESKSRVQKAYADQGKIIASIFESLPPNHYETQVASAYNECRKRWEMLPGFEKLNAREPQIFSRGRIAGYHNFILDQILRLARLWDGDRGIDELGYGYQLYWSHHFNIMVKEVQDQIDKVWDKCWFHADYHMRYHGLKEAIYLLDQDRDITSPTDHDNKHRLYTTNSDRIDDVLTLPGPAMAFKERKAQYIADMDDTEALCHLMGGRNEYTEKRIEGFQKINEGIKSMIVLPIPRNKRRNTKTFQFGIVVLTSSKPVMIGENNLQKFTDSIQPFLWLLAEEPPTNASRLNKMGMDFKNETMDNLY